MQTISISQISLPFACKRDPYRLLDFQQEQSTSMSTSRPQAIPTIQVDNDRVLVTEWRFPPGGETGWHRHSYDYVVVPQISGKLLLESNEGNHYAELNSGISYFRPAGVEHNVVNANEFEYVFVEIEIK